MPQFNDFQVTWNVKLDLLVLRYMAQKVAYCLLDSAASTSFPWVYFAEEHRHRIHRIVIYRRGENLLHGSPLFVGFISGVREHASLAIMQEIHRVDKQFIAELANNTGLLSYSSLELKKGHWFNLVLLRDLTAKTFFKDSTTHGYAAYQLSTQYYAWIRLHHGILPGGLERKDFVVQRTKYYIFPEIGQQPVMGELLYEVPNNQDGVFKESVPVRHVKAGALKLAPTIGGMENAGTGSEYRLPRLPDNQMDSVLAPGSRSLGSRKGVISRVHTVEQEEEEEVAIDERG